MKQESRQSTIDIMSTTLVVAGGLLLAWLTLRLHPVLNRTQIELSYPLLYLGTAAAGFTLLSVTPLLPAVPFKFVERLAGWLNVRPPQLLLLLLAPAFALLARLAAGDGALARSPEIALAAWVLSMAFVTLGWVSRSSRPGASHPWQKLDWLAIALLLIGAFLLRGTYLDQVPATLSGDEGSAGLFAADFQQGRVTNLLNLGWFSFPSFYFWVQSWGIEFLGQTTAGLRLFSAVAGALTVPALYWLIFHLYDRAAAMASAVLLAASHYHIHFSRIGLNNIWDGLFAVLVLGALWRGWRSGSRTWFIVCGLLLGLSQYFYVSMRPFPLILLIWSGVAWWQEPTTFKQRLPDLIAAAAVALVVFLPLALYFTAHLDQFYAPMQRVSIFNGWLDTAVEITDRPRLWIIADQLRKSAFGITHIPLRSWYTPGTGLLLPATAILFCIGLIIALRRRAVSDALILIPLATAVVVGAFSQDMPAAQRYVVIVPLAIALCGLAAARMTGLIGERLTVPPDRQRIPLTVMMIALALFDINFYFREVPQTFTLGGVNTAVATAVGQTLKPYDAHNFTVYFVGAPRMAYRSHSTIPYLLPRSIGHDILEPLTAPPNFSLTPPTAFVILPERFNELSLIQQAYPDGEIQTINDEHGRVLFILYMITS